MTISERVESLLGQMTLEEKAAQMVQVPYTIVGREESMRWAKLGAGSFLHVLGDDAREVQQAAMSSNSARVYTVPFSVASVMYTSPGSTTWGLSRACTACRIPAGVSLPSCPPGTVMSLCPVASTAPASWPLMWPVSVQMTPSQGRRKAQRAMKLV